MPIALDPNRTVEFSLVLDRAEKPEADRPVFFARYVTSRTRAEIADLHKAALDGASDADSLDLVLNGLRLIVVGWRNLVGLDGEPIPFDIDGLPDVLTDTELWELLSAAQRAVTISELELKKSALQSLSGSADSAKDAETETVEPSTA